MPPTVGEDRRVGAPAPPPEALPSASHPRALLDAIHAAFSAVHTTPAETGSSVSSGARAEEEEPPPSVFSRLKAAYEEVAARPYVLPPLNEVGHLTPEEQEALAAHPLDSARRHPRARNSLGGDTPKLQPRSLRSSTSDGETHSTSSSPPSDPACSGLEEVPAKWAAAEAAEALGLVTINTDDAPRSAAPAPPHLKKDAQSADSAPTPAARNQSLAAVAEHGAAPVDDDLPPAPGERAAPPTPRLTAALAPFLESFRSHTQSSSRARLFGSQMSLWTARAAEEPEGSRPPTPLGEQLRLRPRAFERGARHRRHAPFMSWSAGARN